MSSAPINALPDVLATLQAVNMECSGDHAVFISTGLPKVLHQSWDGYGGAGGGCSDGDLYVQSSVVFSILVTTLPFCLLYRKQ